MLCRPLCILLVGLTVCPTLALAESLYVSTTGNDAWPGTIEQPLASLNGAQGRAQPGSEVVLLAGTYPGPVRITASGTAAKPITFIAATDAEVILDGQDMPPLTDLVVISGKHLVFEGFTIANAQGSGISLWGSQNVTVRRNTVFGSERSGIFVGFEKRGVSRDNVVEDNAVYNNALENQNRTMERGWASGIDSVASDDDVYRRNRIYQNFGEGISVMSSKGVFIDANLLYDNFSVNIYLDNAQETKVTGNTVGSSSDTAFFKNGKPAFGSAVIDKEAPISLPSLNNIISGNQWVGVEGIFMESSLKSQGNVLLKPDQPNISQPGNIRLQEQR